MERLPSNPIFSSHQPDQSESINKHSLIRPHIMMVKNPSDKQYSPNPIYLSPQTTFWYTMYHLLLSTYNISHADQNLSTYVIHQDNLICGFGGGLLSMGLLYRECGLGCQTSFCLALIHSSCIMYIHLPITSVRPLLTY